MAIYSFFQYVTQFGSITHPKYFWIQTSTLIPLLAIACTHTHTYTHTHTHTYTRTHTHTHTHIHIHIHTELQKTSSRGELSSHRWMSLQRWSCAIKKGSDKNARRKSKTKKQVKGARQKRRAASAVGEARAARARA